MTPDERPDEFSIYMEPRTKRPAMPARHVLLAGVAAACLMGVGLGLWARPAMSERQAAAAAPADKPAPPAPASARKLEIVVDDRPAPVGPPIPVLPAKPTPAFRLPTIALPEPRAPARPPEGLVRVEAIAPLVRAPQVAAPGPKPAAKLKLAPLTVAAAAPHRLPTVKAPPPVALHLAKAAPASRPVKKIELARAAAAKAAAHRAELLRVQLVHAELVKAAKAEKLEQVRLARAEAKGRAEAVAEARAEARAEALAQAREDARKRARLASVVRALQHALPRAVKPQPPAPVEVARVDRRHLRKSHGEPQMERASLKGHRPARLAQRPIHAHAAPPQPPPRASGLMRVSTPRCASRDAGEAIVCGDPSLGAAERQLARAYQGARAAGVPDAQLQGQQQHWLAARSAAAREAPWAVHDVYLARIAELNSLAKDAHGDSH